MTKPNDVRMGNDKNNSSWKASNKKFDFMFIDCFSFLGLGLGIESNFHLFKCASVALMDIDDGGDNTFLEDASMGGDSSTLFGDVISLDVPSKETKDKSSANHEIMTNEDDKKTVYSPPTISTLTMGQVMEGEKVEEDEGEEEFPSRLVFSGNLVLEARSIPEDEDESKTLNTRSTSRLPSSLDTNTLILTSSLDTKTWHATLSGLQLIETMKGDTTETDIRRKYGNDSNSCLRNLNQIERVPSTVDTCDNDDQSLVSSMSVEEDIFPSEGSGVIIDIDGVSAVEGHSTKNRLFGGEETFRRAWSRNRARVLKKNNGRESWMLQMPTLQSTPSPESFRSTVPVIEPVKSIDPTTIIVDTTEDSENYIYYGENVPFDEPIAYSPRHLLIEETSIAQ